MNTNNEIFKLLEKEIITEDQIRARLKELSEVIRNDFYDKDPVLVGVLKGAFIFMSDLLRALDINLSVDFMAVSSYGSATRTSGVVRILKDLDTELSNRHVLVVEDIVDSGLTLAYLRRNLLVRKPASLNICALLVKEGQQKVDLDIRYVGFMIKPCFVVGYGLDVDERFRNLRGIWTLKER